MLSSKGSLLTTSDMVDVTVTPSRSALYVVLGIGVTLTGGLFVLARQSGWTRRWIYMGRFISQRLVILVCAALWNPVVIRRRMRIHRGTKIWDLLWTVLTFLGVVAVYVVFTGDLSAPAGWLGPPPGSWGTSPKCTFRD